MSKSTNTELAYGEDPECICLRKSGAIICKVCGMRLCPTRIYKICEAHPMAIYFTDFKCCPHCHGDLRDEDDDTSVDVRTGNLFSSGIQSGGCVYAIPSTSYTLQEVGDVAVVAPQPIAAGGVVTAIDPTDLIGSEDLPVQNDDSDSRNVNPPLPLPGSMQSKHLKEIATKRIEDLRSAYRMKLDLIRDITSQNNAGSQLISGPNQAGRSDPAAGGRAVNIAGPPRSDAWRFMPSVVTRRPLASRLSKYKVEVKNTPLDLSKDKKK